MAEGFPGGSAVQNLPADAETQVGSLVQEGPAVSARSRTVRSEACAPQAAQVPRSRAAGKDACSRQLREAGAATGSTARDKLMKNS